MRAAAQGSVDDQLLPIEAENLAETAMRLE
jgi:hypothetical protein